MGSVRTGLRALAMSAALIGSWGCPGATNNGDGGDAIALDGDALATDSGPPTWPAGAALTAIGGLDRVVFSWPSAIDDIGVTAYRVRRQDGTTQALAADARSFTIDGLALDATASLEVQAGDAAGNWSTALRATGTATVPDPARTAPPLGPFEGGPVATHARFLFEGNPPVQVGVRDGAVDPQRIAVVRGRVIDRAGMPVRRVRISVHGASELGYTLTRDDGRYDLVVNGGGAVTIVAEHSTILTAQRRADPSWQGMVDLPDLVVTTRDAAAIALDTSGTQAASQTVRGTEVRDAMGTRRPLLYVRPATRAELVMPDGTTRAAPSLRVHITEFTAGANARNAMPGDLPPNTAFTYAADLVAEEAEAVGAKSVRFSVPVRYYVEPTINVPVGSAVPLGFFERSEDRWRPEDSGVVLRVLTVTGGIAALDINGDGLADDATRLATFEIDDDERRAIAANYSAGATLWRMKLGHFSLPDFNFMRWFAGLFSTPPERPTPIAPSECRSTRAGSIVYCESQVLGERVPVAGSGVFLHYQSDRVPGFVRGYTIKIPLTGPTVEPTLRGVELEVTTAGQVFRRSFPAAPSQSFDYVWDGRDAFGRTVQGAQTAVVRVGFVYQASVSTQSAQARAEDFARNTGETPGRSPTDPITITPGRADDELVIWRRWEQAVGVWDVRREGLGGWSLSAQHRYDPVAQAVLHGDGTIHSAQSLGPVLRTIVGTGQPRGSEDPIPDDSNASSTRVAGIRSMALAPDGSVYIAESYRVHRVSPAGFLRTVAGTGARGSSGDNGPALAAQLDTVNAVAVLRDGSVLIGERLRVRRLRRDGVIEPYAGTGAEGDSGDGGPALSAQFKQIRAITQSIDGSVLIADENANRVRRVSNSGTISTVFGDGSFGAINYDSVAARTHASAPGSLAVDAIGSIYVGVFGRVARIDPDGIVRHVVGLRSGTAAMDGGPASQFALRSQSPQVAIASDGTLFVSDDSVVLSVREGIARVLTRVDSATGERTPEGASAKGATLYAQNALIAHPNGSVWVSEGGIGRVRAITPTLPGLPISDVAVPSTDGSVLDVFGASGRHERVLDARNGRVLQRFFYNAAGYLDRVEDDATNVLRVERNAMGVATAIVAPFGQRTQLAINAQGDLETVRDPAMREWRMRYAATGGQLVSFTDARMGAHTFTYDAAGLLQRDTGPDGAVVSLTRTDTANSVEVSVSNALGNPTRFRMTQDGAGVLEHTTVGADGLNSVTRIPRDGTMVTTLPDRTTLTQRAKPDPVWGMRVPLAERVEIATPAGLRMVSSQDRAVVLRNPNDPTSVTSMTDTFTVNGRRSQRTWDAATRTWTLRSPMGRTTTMVEDANGRLVEARMAGFETMRWTYDARGRVDSASQGMRTQRVGYDAAGNAANNTDALMHMHSATFDSVGRVLTATSSDGRTTSASWDNHDNVTSVTPPGAMAHRFTYTAQDLLETAVPPSAPDGDPTSRTQWDANQRPTSWMAPGGRGATFAYDAANRIESVTTPEGTYRFTYNATSGHLETASNPAGASLALSYDGSLPTEVRWSGDVAGTVARSYDNDFRVTRERVNGANDIAYAYDDDGLLTSVGPVTLARSATNGVIERVSVGTAETSTTLDGYGSPTRITSRVGATTVLDEELTYDGLGRIARKIERVEGVASTIEYAFDGADRLREVRRNGTVIETYAYDANGNRTRAVVDGVTRMGTVDAQDRMQSYGEWTYSYNREGQWTERRHTGNGQVFRYRYDVGGALREVTLPTGRRIEYVIDASGRRVGRRVDGAWTQRWLYRDGLRPIAELDAAGAVQSVFVYGARANVPDAIVRGGRAYRVVSDHLGSVRRVVDAASGAVVQRMSYDAYGRVTEDSAPGWQPFGYGGGLYDSDTGLVRFGARDYDALSGRWTAKDPSGLAGGLNLYEYAAGDPVDLIDMDGNNPLVIFIAEIISNAIWSAMIDILIQVAMDGPRCINWGQVWSAAKSGAFFGGLFGFFKAWNAPWFCLSGCFVAGTWVDTEHGRRPIEEVALGDRVGPESDECRTVSTESWVDIGLEMGPREEAAPGHVVLHLLRPREWAERHGAREGESIELALRELNIEGSARVTSVQRAPALSVGSRCPVTGTIRRSGVSVIVVELERGAPMELTANHRVFSATRNGWVAAGDLLAGEVLQAQEGTVRVRSVHASERGLTSVFNLEVYARHEFFVGEAQVRVHNAYRVVLGGQGARMALQGNQRNIAMAQRELARRQVLAGIVPYRGGSNAQLPPSVTPRDAQRILEIARAAGIQSAYVRLVGRGSREGAGVAVIQAYDAAAQSMGLGITYGRAAAGPGLGEIIRINFRQLWF